jgi:CheY-like chemotaxis protein
VTAERGTRYVPRDPELLKNTFATLGVENPVSIFTSGAELIEYLRRQTDGLANGSPAVLFLDVHLPQIDGFGVIAWVRHQPGLATLKIVVLSGSCTDGDRQQALALGADKFLLKPADPADLREIFSGQAIRNQT